MGRPAAIALALLAAGMVLAGCGLIGGGSPGSEPVRGDQSGAQPGAVRTARDGSPATSSAGVPAPLTNENWEIASQEADRHKGESVTLTGEVFNLLGSYDGFHHFQIYTDPQARKGNTHVAVREDPRLKKGYQVLVVGTVRGTLVTKAVSGRELRVPEVEAEKVEIIGPASVVTPTTTPSPTIEPTATRTPTPVPTGVPPTSTPVPTAEPPATAAPPTATLASQEEPSATPAQPTETAEASPTAEKFPTAESSPGPQAAPSATPVQGELPLTAPAAAAQLSGPMVTGEGQDATGGRYINTTRSDQGWNGVGSPPPTGEATLQVEVPRDGTYAIWARMWYEHVNANSFWLIVDDGPAIKVGNEDQGYETWKWVGWRDGDTNNRVQVELTAGVHTIRLVGREAGTRIDTVVVTDDLNYTPE